jgi:hypothetical protein
MKTKILILIYLLIIGTFTYFVYPIFHSRYFPTQENGSEKSSPAENKKIIQEESSSNTNNDSEDTPDESTVPDDILIDINTEDCEDNCEQFEDAEEKKYCQEYCGLSGDSTTSTDDCEKLVNLEKDYCYKNQAISKKDFTLCKKITDKKILESCKTRLTEDLINNKVID